MSEPSPVSERSRIAPDSSRPREGRRLDPRLVITAVLFIAIIGLAIWYLVRPEPLLVQGEAESTPIDIAARLRPALWDVKLSL